MNKVLDILNDEEIRLILKTLCKEPDIAKKVEFIANQNVCEINIEKIANDVFFALNSLDVEDLWFNSGAQIGGGYEDPIDVACQMVDDILCPFDERISNYSKLRLNNEAKLYCMGVLKGIMQYTQNSESKFKDWAADYPETCFENTLTKWKENCSNKVYIIEMDRYIQRLSNEE
jgi:hypothetical protein